MLNQCLFKICINRNHLKNKDSLSPIVKYKYSLTKINSKEYYKPLVQLISEIIKERRNYNVEN